MVLNPERSLDEWARYFEQAYSSIRKPGWREFAPKQSYAHSQRILFAAFYKWREANPGPDGERTGPGMERMIDAFIRWAEQQTGDGRTTAWILWSQFTEGMGTLAAATPEAAIRAALKSLPKRAQLALLLRLASELV